eukprot:1046341-Pelagomonas_calceolata.AAC.1
MCGRGSGSKGSIRVTGWEEGEGGGGRGKRRLVRTRTGHPYIRICTVRVCLMHASILPPSPHSVMDSKAPASSVLVCADGGSMVQG